MTGFGSALGKLLDFNAIKNVSDVLENFQTLRSINIEDDLNTLIIKLDSIRIIAKKIGNDQRMFFHFFFRELLDPKSDGFMNIQTSINEAYKQYERKTQ